MSRASESEAPRRDSFPGAVVKLGRLAERQMQYVLAHHGLTASQFLALSFIAHNPGTSRAALGRGLHLSAQAAGGLVRQLLARRLISREHAGKGSAVELRPTADGLALLRRSDTAIDYLTRRMLRSLPPPAAAALDRTVRHLLTTLEQDGEPVELRGDAAP